MIVKSILAEDLARGTTTLGQCCETTVSGFLLTVGDIARCLVWHSPMQFKPYEGVMREVRRLADQINATGVRVSDITNTLFALGFYPKGVAGTAAPLAVLLIQLDDKGHLLRAEELGEEGAEGELSALFHAHKNDPRTPEHLEATMAAWNYGQLLSKLLGGQLQLKPYARTEPNRKDRREDRQPQAQGKPPGKPGKPGGPRQTKPQFFQKRPPKTATVQTPPGTGKTREQRSMPAQNEQNKEAA